MWWEGFTFGVLTVVLLAVVIFTIIPTTIKLTKE